MRRLSASLLVGLLVSAPALALRCAVACAPEPPRSVVARAGGCHHSPAPDPNRPAVANRHECADQGSPDAGRTSRTIELERMPAAPLAMAMAAPGLASTERALAAAPPGDPPGRFLAPLRL